VPYFDTAHFQTTQATFTSDCSACHAVTGTSPNPASPLCTVCHTSGPTLPYANCTSCHGSSTSGGAPTGTAYPNVAGAHAAHIALNGAGTPISCATCHNGLGTGTFAHYNAASATVGGFLSPGTVAFLATYNAATGASSFDNVALTCLNVSCHGGQANLNWRTGTLDVNVNTGCESCHAFDGAQSNTYSSGQHDSGGHNGEGCTACHDPVLLAPGHFTNLATAAIFEQSPAATLRSELQYNGTTCNPDAGGLTGCHGSENWN